MVSLCNVACEEKERWSPGILRPSPFGFLPCLNSRSSHLLVCRRGGIEGGPDSESVAWVAARRAPGERGESDTPRGGGRLSPPLSVSQHRRRRWLSLPPPDHTQMDRRTDKNRRDGCHVRATPGVGHGPAGGWHWPLHSVANGSGAPLMGGASTVRHRPSGDQGRRRAAARRPRRDGVGKAAPCVCLLRLAARRDRLVSHRLSVAGFG